MKNVIARERILFDNYDMDSYYKWAEECLKENCEGEEEFSDSEIEEVAYDLVSQDFDIILSELENFFGDNEIICFGSIGRWNGVYDGGKIFGDFKDAFYFMIKDCWYYKIYDENGHLFVHCSHHDGSCTFEIKIINEKGKDYYRNWNEWVIPSDKRTEREVHSQIIKRYSTIPNFAHKVYGMPRIENEKPTKENMQKKLFNEAKSFYS